MKLADTQHKAFARLVSPETPVKFRAKAAQPSASAPNSPYSLARVAYWCGGRKSHML